MVLPPFFFSALFLFLSLAFSGNVVCRSKHYKTDYDDVERNAKEYGELLCLVHFSHLHVFCFFHLQLYPASHYTDTRLKKDENYFEKFLKNFFRSALLFLLRLVHGRRKKSAALMTAWQAGRTHIEKNFQYNGVVKKVKLRRQESAVSLATSLRLESFGRPIHHQPGVWCFTG
jgi:hypothetical protein